MKMQWYVKRFKNGRFIDMSPFALTKSEAKNIEMLGNNEKDGFTYKAEIV